MHVSKENLLLDKARVVAQQLNCAERFEERLQNLTENDILKKIIDFLDISWSLAKENDTCEVADIRQKNKLLQELQDSESSPMQDPPGFKPFYQLFEEQVAKNPEQIAVIYNDDELSYEQLNYQINQLAHNLIQLKNARHWPDQTCIGLLFENSPEAIITIIAVMKAQLAYVPLTIDEKLSYERLASYITFSKIELIITQTDLMQHSIIHFIQNQNSSLTISSYDDFKQHRNCANPNIEVRPNQLTYIIFSSGSTGEPKGIRVAHRGLINPVMEIKDNFDIKVDDRIGWYSLLTFDASLLDIMTALGTGATCVIIPNPIRKDKCQLKNYLINKNVTIVTLVPSILETLNPEDLPNLRGLISTGETVNEKIFGDWLTKGRPLQSPRILLNGYGPTEVTICTALGRYLDKTQTLTIGQQPIRGLKWYLLTPGTEEQPYPRNPSVVKEGEEGELYLTGEGLALGYVNESADYQQRFRTIYDPNDPSKLIWIYQTGDIMRRVDGSLQYIERIDAQSKFLGELIHPGAIVKALLEYKQGDQLVFANAKVIIERKQQQPFIHAYLKLHQDIDIAPTQKLIRQVYFYLRHHQYCNLAPSRFSFVNRWPTNAHGKLQENGLVESTTCTFYPQHAFHLTADDEVADKITLMWHEILAIPKDSPLYLDDHFYDLGGNSVLSVLLFEKLRQLFPSFVKNFALFNAAPTIRNLTTQIRLRKKDDVLVKKLNESIQWIEPPRSTVGTPNSLFPVVLIHSVSGDAALDFKNIIENWRNIGHWPLLAIRAPSLDNPSYVSKSIPELASNYLELLKTVLAGYSGPLMIIGYSAGGIIGYEMASQLQQDNIPATVCCIDVASPTHYQLLSQSKYAEEVCALMQHTVSKVMGITLGTWPMTAEELGCYSKQKQLSVYWQKLQEELIAKTLEDKQRHLGIYSTLENMITKQLEYKPAVINGVNLFVLGDTRKKCSNDQRLGWGQSFLLNITQIDGEHLWVAKTEYRDWVQKEVIPKLKLFIKESQESLAYTQKIKELMAKIDQYKKLYLNSENSYIQYDAKKSIEIEQGFIQFELRHGSGKSNQSMALQEVLTQIKNQRSSKTIIFGPLGAGKTSLCRYIANQWAKGNLWKHYDLIYWQSVGNIRAIDPVQSSLGELKNIVQGFENIEVKKILLLLDGYDELDKDSNILEYIRELLNSSFDIILTSRPLEGPLSLHGYDNYNVAGFNDEHIEHYVSTYFKHERHLADQLICVIKKDQSLTEFVLFPLNLSLLCQYWAQTQQNRDELDDIVQTSEFINYIIDELSDIYSRRLNHNDDKESLFKKQETVQKLLEEIAAKVWLVKNRLMTRGIIESVMTEYHSRNKINNVSRGRIAAFIQDLLASGFIKSDNTNQDSSGHLQEFHFFHPHALEHLTVIYLSKRLNSNNSKEFESYTTLIEKYPILYNAKGQNNDNEALKKLLKLQAMKAVDEFTKSEILKCLSGNIRSYAIIEQSPVYDLIWNKLGEQGITAINRELQAQYDHNEIDDECDFKSLLIQIHDYKPDDNIIKYLGQSDDFFRDKVLFLSDPNGVFSTSAKIITADKSRGQIRFELENRSEVIVELRNNNFHRISIATSRIHNLYDFLVDYYDSSTEVEIIFNNQSHGNTSIGINDGRYILKQQEVEGKKGKLLGIGATVAHTVLQLVHMNRNYSECCYEICFEQSPSSKIKLVDKRSSRSELFLTKEKLKNYQTIVLVRNFIESIQLNNVKDKVKVRKKMEDENEIMFKKLLEIENQREHMRKMMLENESKPYLHFILDYILENELREISDQVMDRVIKNITGLGEKLAIIRRLSYEIGIETTTNKILTEISFLANYSNLIRKDLNTNVLKVMQLLEKAEWHAERVCGKTTILLEGSTGSGKSTVVNNLIGVPLEKTQNKYGQTIIQVSNPNNLDPSQYSKIGQSICSSETIFTQGYSLQKQLKKLPDNLRSEAIMVLDSAGNKDTRGIDYEIINSLSRDRVIDKTGSVRAIVLLIPYVYFITERATLVIDAFNRLNEKFNSNILTDKSLKRSLFLIVTKHDAYPQANSTFSSLLDDLLKDERKQSEYQRQEHQINNPVIEKRALVWQTLQELYNDKQVDFINFDNISQRTEMLRKYINAPAINKLEFMKALGQDHIQRTFGAYYQTLIDTWQRGIIQHYLDDIPNEIAKIQGEIDGLKKESVLLERKNVELKNLIQKAKDEIKEKIKTQALHEGELKKLSDLSCSEKTDLHSQLIKNSKHEKIKDLERIEYNLKLINEDLDQKNTRLVQTVSELLTVEGCIRDMELCINTKTSNIKDLSLGHQKIILEEFKVQPNEEIKIHVLKKGSLQKAYGEGRQIVSDDVEKTKLVPAKEISGPLHHLIPISRDYCIMPKDKAQRDQFILLNQSGEYVATIEGIKWEIDLGKKSLDEFGKKIIYSIVTFWTPGKELPFFRIIHKIPKAEFNRGEIVNLEAQLKEAQEKLPQLNDALLRLKAKKQVIEDEIKLKTDKIVILKVEKNSLEELVVKDDLQAVIEQERKSIKQLESTIVDYEEDIAKNVRHLECNLSDILSKESKLQGKNREKRNYIVIIKTQLEIAKLTRKFAMLAANDVLIEKRNANSMLSNACKDFISYFDQNFDKLVRRCDEDLENYLSSLHKKENTETPQQEVSGSNQSKHAREESDSSFNAAAYQQHGFLPSPQAPASSLQGHGDAKHRPPNPR
jgi:non-ribosomal peptide synthetase component F/thioesterase domain-containing protein/energy-coupling factor transporter ATP-binding protein EcfA2